LWWNLNDPQLSDVIRQLISDGRNEIYLSAASTWEIAIKAAKGRLELPVTPSQFIANSLSAYKFRPLAVELSHSLEVYHLPTHHIDPFDRMLIAQSRLEDMPLLTADAEIVRYEVETIW
jgi:PIN domain nuclease of toxin-antitoxin system